jgi:hypothetical protein
MGHRPVFDHLGSLTTPLGLYEHALGTTPRIEHAYCVDDVARGLIVATREPNPSPQVLRLAEGYLEFVLDALSPDGLLHNRRNLDGTWADRPTAADHWGRALWAMGTASAHSPDPDLAARARAGANVALRSRSRWPRAMAYAALGAGQLLTSAPDHVSALRLLADTRRDLPRTGDDPTWPWPEERLTYANPVLPEAMIIVGTTLEDEGVLGEGHRWITVIEQCLAWFTGANDGGVPMSDPVTGGGFDGLEKHGSSRNQGAESTLAWMSTIQLALLPQLADAS